MIDVERHEQRDWERRGYRVVGEAATWWGVTIYMALPCELREMGWDKRGNDLLTR